MSPGLFCHCPPQARSEDRLLKQEEKLHQHHSSVEAGRGKLLLDVSGGQVRRAYWLYWHGRHQVVLTLTGGLPGGFWIYKGKAAILECTLSSHPIYVCTLPWFVTRLPHSYCCCLVTVSSATPLHNRLPPLIHVHLYTCPPHLPNPTFTVFFCLPGLVRLNPLKHSR